MKGKKTRRRPFLVASSPPPPAFSPPAALSPRRPLPRPASISRAHHLFSVPLPIRQRPNDKRKKKQKKNRQASPTTPTRPPSSRSRRSRTAASPCSPCLASSCRPSSRAMGPWPTWRRTCPTRPSTTRGPARRSLPPRPRRALRSTDEERGESERERAERRAEQSARPPAPFSCPC